MQTETILILLFSVGAAVAIERWENEGGEILIEQRNQVRVAPTSLLENSLPRGT